MSRRTGALASSVRPTGAYLPRPDVAATVLAPRYDSPASGTAAADSDNPLAFLNQLRAEIDAPQHTDAEREAMLDAAVQRLDEILASSSFELYPAPVFFVCRLEADGHAQTGIIADVALEAYDRGLVKVHELTRKGQEDRLVEYMSEVQASFLPVFLIHRPAPTIDSVIAATVSRAPTIDVAADDGLQLTIWAVTDADGVGAISDALAELDALYVADGHHRAAAASRFAAACREANPDHTGDEPYAHMVAVLFAADQLMIQPYDRCLSDLNGRTPSELLAEVRAVADVQEVSEIAGGPDPGSYLMRLDQRWYRVTPRAELHDGEGVAGLDVSFLHEHVLQPIFGIDDPRTDPRLEFIPGTRGPGELAKLCHGEGTASFALHPMSVSDLMDVSDRGELLPPKSTYFVPKLRSGLVVRLH